MTDSPTAPESTRPVFEVSFEDGSTRRVKPAIPDYVRWEKYASETLVEGADHSFTRAAYLAWACMRRHQDTDLTFDAFARRLEWFDIVDSEAAPDPTQ